ncbi:MAG: hypothetical protein AAGA40_02700 [Cyanobacteria bacterium P01_E01_bin.45]
MKMYTLNARAILSKSADRKTISVEECRYLKRLMSQDTLDIEDRLAICILEQAIWNGDIDVVG